MSFTSRVVFIGILIFASLVPINEAVAQRTKKSSITDGFGLLAGVNVVLFYPKDVNKNPINGGDPELVPAGMLGLSYYHTFSPRWAHIFQLRVSDHQIKYWKTSDQHWTYNHERVTVKADSGDYHLKYREVSMNYMIGWCLNKKASWHFYAGLQVNGTVKNYSTKTVDGIVNGKLVGFDYHPFPEPTYYFDQTSITYSPDINAEVLLRTDFKIKLSDQLNMRPVLEFGFDPGHVQVSIKDRLAFYIEIYKVI